MDYTIIDMDSFPRKTHFEHFNSLGYPYAAVTVNVDITDFLRGIKERAYPFFLSMLYCAERAANAVPQFRQRIKDGGIIQYDWCISSHTLALNNDTYRYCPLDSRGDFETFLESARATQKRVAEGTGLEEENPDELLFISSVPWISFTAIINPVPYPADSNPRINWGKFFSQGDRMLLPMCVQCNHALVDGLHIARFFQNLEKELAALIG